METVKNALLTMVDEIEANDNKVSDDVCIRLWDMIWSAEISEHKELWENLQVIHHSSKAASGKLIKLTLKLLADTL